jgi:nucleotide-binding universal stress UspA family protein/CheY-like chemotaxis protein
VVVVADDEESLRLLCRVNLEAEGYEVLEAATARELDRALDARAVSALLLDIALGADDGVEIARRLRHERPGLGVAFFTGKALAADDEEAALVDEILSKPFTPEQLAAVVGRLVRRGQARTCDAPAMSTIVVGFDDREPAKRALERGMAEARERGGRLVVVAVAEMPFAPDGPQNFGTFDDGSVSLEPEKPAALEPVLAHAREVIEAAGLEADYAWALGDPGRAIVDVARDRGAGLIVVGSHHEGLLARLFGASVADEVRREAGCEVVVVD